MREGHVISILIMIPINTHTHIHCVAWTSLRTCQYWRCSQHRTRGIPETAHSTGVGGANKLSVIIHKPSSEAENEG